MKSIIMGRCKWYLVAVIVVVLIVSIGLSFCVWDTTSVNNLAMSGKTADASQKYGLVSDVNSNSIADVGDIVTFGRYYQSSVDDSKTPLRWIVVHKENNDLTLLTESVVAFGSAWGRNYHDGSAWVYLGGVKYNQNYLQSNLAIWLNSTYTTVPSDGGSAFSANADKLAMRGFMSEAFSENEASYIKPRTIANIVGYPSGGSTKINYGTADYNVWIPSWTEVFGSELAPGNPTYGIPAMTVTDGTPNTQFSYFVGSNDAKKAANTTAFASTPSKSNYTMNTAAATAHRYNAQDIATGAKGNAWWWLRSPVPYRSSSHAYLMVGTVQQNSPGGSPGSVRSDASDRSYGGIRPAVCIPA